MNQRSFYEALATELIDNFYERPYLGGGRTAGASKSHNKALAGRLTSGVRIRMTPTKQKRCNKYGKVTAYALQKTFGVCKIYKTTNLCFAFSLSEILFGSVEQRWAGSAFSFIYVKK